MTTYRELVDSAESAANSYDWADERHDGAVQYAQVMATLALAEQQRIANLIALGTVYGHPGSPPPLRSLVFEPVNDYETRPTEQIRKAVLGE